MGCNSELGLTTIVAIKHHFGNECDIDLEDGYVREWSNSYWDAERVTTDEGTEIIRVRVSTSATREIGIVRVFEGPACPCAEVIAWIEENENKRTLWS